MVAKSSATKRAAAKAPASAPAQKKAKMDPNCRGVLEALQMADLPCSVKQMLEATAPKAFETAKEERHFSQEAVVNMIGEALEGVAAKLEDAMAVVAKQVEESEEKKAALASSEETATTALTEAVEKATAAKSVLTDLSESLAAAKAALAEAQEAQAKGDADFNKAKDDKAALETVMSGSLAAIVEGTGDDLAEHLEKLAPFFETLTLDESLRSALPSSCQKKADTRGGFDTMVVGQMRTHFEERLEALRSAIEAGEPSAQERSALVASKEAEVAEASSKVEGATRTVEEAESASAVAAAELDKAQAALKEFQVGHSELVKVLEQKTDEVENFKTYNVGCFDLLKSKTALPASADPASTAVTGGA